MSKTYVFKYHGDDAESEGSEDFTATVDDSGKIVSSTNESVEARKNDPLFNRLSVIKRRYYNQNYGITVEGEDDDKDVEKQFGEVGELAKYDMDKQIVFGWAYVTHDKDGKVVVDKSGEFVDDYEELEVAAYEFVIKSRTAGDHHQRDLTAGDSPKKVGTMVESMVFTPEKIEKMGLPKGVLPTGWWVGFKIEDAAVWKAVKEGKRPAFSIHGKAHREEVK